MSDLDRLLKLSGLVQGSGFEAPVQEGKMSDLDIEAQENSREDFVDMHTKTFGSAEEAGKFWDDSKASRDESNESLETEDYDSKPGEEIAHASEKRKSKKLPYKDWGKAGDPKDDRYRVPKIKTFSGPSILINLLLSFFVSPHTISTYSEPLKESLALSRAYDNE